ncbi:hypothetical protein KGS77_33200 [Streptomyces sp. MST-110588]|nr:hypothetical protein KGS77_33200 [Streptomyces sp. MST-110588]
MAPPPAHDDLGAYDGTGRRAAHRPGRRLLPRPDAGPRPTSSGAPAPAAPAADSLRPAPSAAGGKVVGDFTNWGVYGRNYPVKAIWTSESADRLTHINYAFGNGQSGRCTIGDAYADHDKAYTADRSVDGKADTWDAGALRGNVNQLRKPAPHSPPTSYNGITKAGSDTTSTVKKLTGAGIPPGKLLLGLGFYGRDRKGVTRSTPGGTANGAAPDTYETGIEEAIR